ATGYNNALTPTVADDKSNTWKSLASYNDATFGYVINIYITSGAAVAGTQKVTVTYTDSTPHLGEVIQLMEFRGILTTANPADGSAGATIDNSTPTPITGGSVTAGT